VTEAQQRYLEAAGNPKVHEEEDKPDGWILVDLGKQALGEIAGVIANLEQTVTEGERVNLVDSTVWVDHRGFEHYGPGEAGYDRYDLDPTYDDPNKR